MKKKILHHLLVVVGVIMLVGLVASCGGEEPRFKVIDSREYNAANKEAVWTALYDKHMNGKSSLSNASTIFEPYKNDVWDLVKKEMGKMSSVAAGICVVIKVDTYKLLGLAYYKNDGGRSMDYSLYNY